MRADAFVAVGSNIDPDDNIAAAISRLVDVVRVRAHAVFQRAKRSLGAVDLGEQGTVLALVANPRDLLLELEQPILGVGDLAFARDPFAQGLVGGGGELVDRGAGFGVLLVERLHFLGDAVETAALGSELLGASVELGESRGDVGRVHPNLGKRVVGEGVVGPPGFEPGTCRL